MLPHPEKSLRKPFYMILILCLGLSFFALIKLIHVPLSLTFLDIGQGDAILIQTPEYKNILIDSGKEGNLIIELDKKLHFFNRKIDLLVLTHPDRDHFEDMFDVLDNYPVKQFMTTGIVSQDPLYQALLKKIKEKQIPIILAKHDQDIQISNEAFLDILYPFSNQSLLGKEVKNKNNTSISILLRDGQKNPLALLTGDAEEAQEKELVMSGQDLQSPIYKLGHHGSKTSTSEIFLNAIQPQTVIVSAGKDNHFGHPHEEVMERVNNLDIRRTDEEGSIRFVF